MHRVEVLIHPNLPDARGESLVKDISDLGIGSVTGASVSDIYYIEAALSQKELEDIAARALSDELTQTYRIGLGEYTGGGNGSHSFEVAYNPGVTDPLEASVLKSVSDLGINAVKAVITATRYQLFGNPTGVELGEICSRLLVNPTVQHIVTDRIVEPAANPVYEFELKTVELLDAGEKDLAEIGADLGFSAREIWQIRDYYKILAAILPTPSLKRWPRHGASTAGTRPSRPISISTATA